MNRITLGKLFELYVDIFDKFGLHLLTERDQIINYYVLEVTDISIGYCSDRILVKFLENGMIDERIYEVSQIFLKKFRKLETVMLTWDAESIKNSSNWKKLMEMSDNIKGMIRIKWTEEELKEIFKFEQPVNLEI